MTTKNKKLCPLKEPTPWRLYLTEGTYVDGVSLAVFFDVKEKAGFVYLITHKKTGKAYVGRKYLKSNTSKPPLKGKKRRRRSVTDSNWQTYKSSCKPLKELIKAEGVSAFTFEILSCHGSKAATNFCEVEEMFMRGVLYTTLSDGTPAYFNDNIMSRWFRTNIGLTV